MGMESVLALWPSCRRIAASRGKWVSRTSVSGSLSTRYVLTSTYHSALSHSASFYFTLSHFTLSHFTFSHSTFSHSRFSCSMFCISYSLILRTLYSEFSNSLLHSHSTTSSFFIPNHPTFHSTFSHSTLSHSTFSHSTFSHSPCPGPR